MNIQFLIVAQAFGTPDVVVPKNGSLRGSPARETNGGSTVQLPVDGLGNELPSYGTFNGNNSKNSGGEFNFPCDSFRRGCFFFFIPLNNRNIISQRVFLQVK